MEKTLYFLLTFLESVLAVFGIRATFKEPRYAIVQRLGGGIEIRSYAPRVAAETSMGRGGDAQAFRRLFDFIAGANRRDQRIAMTAPVENGGERIAMTVPVEQGGEAGVMRFYLPEKVAADAPRPTDARVRIVDVPAQTLAVLRFSGVATKAVRDERQKALLDALAGAGRQPQGAPFFMGYDPPFSFPFLRRNEVAVALAAG